MRRITPLLQVKHTQNAYIYVQSADHAYNLATHLEDMKQFDQAVK
jgi:hypothetical protein